MDGVTILNTFVCSNPDFLRYTFSGIFIIVLGILGFIAFIQTRKEGEIIYLFASLFIIALGIFTIKTPGDEIKSKETRYQVTVDDSVNMNDFLSRYEIIDVEGKIYTVKEIDEEP